MDAVAESIKQCGYCAPIIVDEDGVILAGHTRLKALTKLGWERAEVVVKEGLTDEQKRKYRLLDNKVGELATWDFEALHEEMAGLDFGEFDFGFFNGEIKQEETKEDDFNVDRSYGQKPTITKYGDVIILGRHRLLCGDATKKEDADKLFNGKAADMIFTDPPYNVDYHGGTIDNLSIMNDKMENDTFFNFLHDAFINMTNHLNCGGAVYICHADTEGINFRKAFIDSGLLLKQCLVWVKNSLVLGRQDYHWQHEPILYGWKPGKSHNWNGDRKQTTAIKPDDIVSVEKTNEGYEITVSVGFSCIKMLASSYEVISRTENSTIILEDKPKRNAEHPTMKPVSLCGRAIKNSSRSGEVVADYFGGSGSTLIACEQLNRTCYMMELDPKYCDVIIERWETLTGEKAVYVNAAD